MTLYILSQPSAWPYGITAGRDGNLMFSEVNVNQIGKITPSGVITEYKIPTSNSMPRGMEFDVGILYSVITPLGVIFPIWFTLTSENIRLPSRPAVMP